MLQTNPYRSLYALMVHPPGCVDPMGTVLGAGSPQPGTAGVVQLGAVPQKLLVSLRWWCSRQEKVALRRIYRRADLYSWLDWGIRAPSTLSSLSSSSSPFLQLVLCC